MRCTRQGAEVCPLRGQSLRRALQVNASVLQAFAGIDQSMWTAEILREPPVSGTVPELQFDCGDSGSPWLWVSFRDSEDTGSWAGCFRYGPRGFNFAEAIPESGEALVIASGQGYWVSLANRTLRYQEGTMTAAMRVPGPDEAFVVTDDCTVSLLSAAGVVWTTDRISLDGITFNRATRSLLMGEAQEPGGPVPYEIDLASGTVRGGWSGL